MTASGSPSARQPADAELRAALDETERRLDPADPEADGRVQVLGYGEVSVALTVSALPGLVCKRMSGFADGAAVSVYRDLLDTYIAEVRRAGIRVIETWAVPVMRPDRAPVVYLVQPRVTADSLGNALIIAAHDDVVTAAIRSVLGAVTQLAEHTRSHPDGLEVALDGQLSNWSFGSESQELDPGTGTAPTTTGPLLIDVGTPFMRHRGQHAIDREFLLAPVPAGIRAYYRRRRLVEAYLDDYFTPRLVALDMLGNFHKEGAPDRIDLATDVVNEWLVNTDLPGPRAPITRADVDAYYRKDADLLALYLRLRRMDRLVQTRALRRTYDYVLPGNVAR